MKCAIVAGYPDSLVRFRGELIRELISRGVAVHAIAPDLQPGTKIHDQLVAQGVRSHRVELRRAATSPFQDLRSLLRLIGLFRREAPDIVLSYTIKPVIYGTIAAWVARVPNRIALITGVGYLFTGDRAGVASKVARILYRFALARAHTVIFQNRDDQQLFLKLGMLPSVDRSILVNGSGVDLNKYAAHPVATESHRFLMIARLLADKGVREYAEAARRLREKNVDATFCLAGWIDDHPNAIARNELETWVKDGRIDYLGFLEDVRPAIRDSMVFVLPSYREGTPRTVLEAMAMARPIITTDAPGCRETVREGENGFLVPPKSVDKLVDAMWQFINDPEKAVEMGLRSRQIVEEKFDVKKVNAAMLRAMGIG